MKENKKRIIFWGIVFLLFIICSLCGMYFYNNGYGKYGKIKAILKPIAEEFNKNDNVIKFGDLNATVKNDKIVVHFDIQNLTFEYIYKNSSIETLTCTYQKKQSTVGDIVAYGMIDAVYKLNGGNNSIQNDYDLILLKQSTIEDGLTFIEDKDKTITLDINKNLYENISNKIAKRHDKYIKEEDLTSMLYDLSQNQSYKKVKSDIILYVTETDTIDIYIQGNQDYEMYKSLLNVVKVINENTYNELRDSNNNIKLENDSPYYTYSSNYNFEGDGIFYNKNNIFHLTLYK